MLAEGLEHDPATESGGPRLWRCDRPAVVEQGDRLS